jgi:uncharacterized protein (TIGR03435 family)
MLMRVSVMLVLSGLAAFRAGAQSFDVASVKRCQDSESPSLADPDPGRLRLACVTTVNLIRLAYLVFPTGEPNAPVSPTVFQEPISGGPTWIDSDRYTVDAKSSTAVNVEMMKGPMMQRLLEERFSLKTHWETKQKDLFELTVVKDGPNLQRAKEGGCVPSDRNHPLPAPAPGEPAPVACGVLRLNSSGGFDIAGVTMADLCRQLSAYVDREIVNKTGITGVFDAHLDFNRSDIAPDGDGNASVIAAAVKKLGLQMRPAKGPAQVLVIDRVERPYAN